jgi:hypothetical protein
MIDGQHSRHPSRRLLSHIGFDLLDAIQIASVDGLEQAVDVFLLNTRILDDQHMDQHLLKLADEQIVQVKGTASRAGQTCLLQSFPPLTGLRWHKAQMIL